MEVSSHQPILFQSSLFQYRPDIFGCTSVIVPLGVCIIDSTSKNVQKTYNHIYNDSSTQYMTDGWLYKLGDGYDTIDWKTLCPHQLVLLLSGNGSVWWLDGCPFISMTLESSVVGLGENWLSIKGYKSGGIANCSRLTLGLPILFFPVLPLVRQDCSWSNSRSSNLCVSASFCWIAILNREFKVFFSSSAAASCLCISSSCVTYSSHLLRQRVERKEKRWHFQGLFIVEKIELPSDRWGGG